MATGWTATSGQAPRSSWRWLGAVAGSVVVVVGLGVLDTAVAHDRDDLHALRYGVPVVWAVQESTLDPPTLPVSIPFSDPHEMSTRVLWPQLGIDAALVLALLLGAWSLLALSLGRPRARPDARRTPSTAARE